MKSEQVFKSNGYCSENSRLPILHYTTILNFVYINDSDLNLRCLKN